MKVCIDCIHHETISEIYDTLPMGFGQRTYTEHQCHAMDGQPNPITGDVITGAKCETLRLSDFCGVDAKLFAPSDPKKFPATETDDAYRMRLLLLVGQGSVNAPRLATASGAVLDAIGSYYEGGKRR